MTQQHSRSTRRMLPGLLALLLAPAALGFVVPCRPLDHHHAVQQQSSRSRSATTTRLTPRFAVQVRRRPGRVRRTYVSYVPTLPPTPKLDHR